MSVRAPAMAGLFYPGGARACREALASCLAAAVVPGELKERRVVGGIVPHAGWVYSGSVAGRVFAAAGRSEGAPRSYVLFGAVHRPIAGPAAVYASGAWETPLGRIEVDSELAEAMLSACPDLHEDEPAHVYEHSLEVQVPFIQHLDPQARIVPIMVLPTEAAVRMGRSVGELVRKRGREVVFVGSSDLTHYGPRFGFTPQGRGPGGIQWAKDVNDRRMIDRLVAMKAESIVEEAARHHNACGSGALAATVEACRECGATRGILLAHRNSVDAESERGLGGAGEPSDAVGYAGIVYV